MLPERTTSRTGNPTSRTGTRLPDAPAGTDEDDGAVLNQEPRDQRALRRFDEVRCIYPAFSVLPLPPAWVLSLSSLSVEGRRRYWLEAARTEAWEIVGAVQSRRSHNGRWTRGWMSPLLAGHASWRSRDVHAERQEGGDRRRCAVQHPYTAGQLLEKLPARFVLIPCLLF
jgi:hypothetical protein